MANKMSLSERRFRDGTGVQYLQDGRVRCHSIAKSKVRKWREENNDYETPVEDFWPECQCHLAAIPGSFVCSFHGGLTPHKNRPNSILDVMPMDLAEKMAVMLDSAEYMDSREDILLVKARQWELLEQMQQEAGGPQAWEKVEEALVELRRGDEQKAEALLSSAVKAVHTEREAWDEIYKASEVIKDLRATQVKTAKELRLMATADQVLAFIRNIQQAIIDGAKEYIDEPKKQARFLQYVSGEISRFANLGPATVSARLESGRREVGRDAE